MTTEKPRREKPKKSTGEQTNIHDSSSLVKISSNMLSQYPREGNLILAVNVASQKIMDGMGLSPVWQAQCRGLTGKMELPPALQAECGKLMGGMGLTRSVTEALAKMGGTYPRPNIAVVRETLGYLGMLTFALQRTSCDRLSHDAHLLTTNLIRKDIPRLHGMLAYIGGVSGQVQNPVQIQPRTNRPIPTQSKAYYDALICRITPVEIEGINRKIAKLTELMEEDKSRTSSLKAELAELHMMLDQVLEKGFELSEENQKLNEALHNGLLQFLKKIGVHNAQYICAILVHGDISKAARALNMKDSTLRYKMNHLEGQGISGDELRRIIEWRKQLGAIRTVPYDDLRDNQGAQRDDAELLKDMLNALESANKDNWQHICNELIEIIRPEVL